MKNIFLLFCILMNGVGLAQDRCGQTAYMNYLYSKNPGLKKQHDSLNILIRQRINIKKLKMQSQVLTPEVVYEVPVVVHVIHSIASGVITGTNISDAQIRSQIDILNQDYSRTNADTVNTYGIYKSVAADSKIHFCLASIDPNGGLTNGIVRVYSQQTSFGTDDRVKALSDWPNDKYLNLWVCNLSDNVLGYAQFPNISNTNPVIGLSDNNGYDATDGVVIHYKAFGNIGTATPPYHLGRTATHEIGHWLGLAHIWGDGDCNLHCGDDYVSDTPVQRNCSGGSTCSMTYSDCLGPTTLDMNQDYMDYSADACMNMFSQGQKDRMRTVMELSPKRAALMNAISCCSTGNKEVIPYSINFEDETYVNEMWRTVNYDSTSAFTKKWERISPGAYAQSDYSFRIENDSVYTSVNTKYWDAFVSPYVDLSPAQKPRLDFDLAYAYGPFNYNTDSLVVSYSEGCKNVWVPLTTLYGNDLVSTERRTSHFSPDGNEWKKISVNLQSLYKKVYVKFRIAVYSKGVNNLYIDNINFYKISDDFSMNLYPIPAKDKLDIELIYTGYKDVAIEAFNMLGKRIFSMEKTNTTSFIKPIDISEIAAGVYIIKVTSGSNHVTKKIVIE